MKDFTSQTIEAREEWFARRERRAHPRGSFDNGGRWWPAAEEEQACCRRVRTPSRSFPYSLLTHCRTVEHVAMLYGVPAAELRRAVRAAKPPAPPRREGGEYFKAVAVQDGRFLSIFDGVTEYVLGQTVAETPRQRHRGGIYVYRTLREAEEAEVPTRAVLYDAPRAILRVRAEGAYCRYENGKLAFARVTPLEVVRA